jgi:hypothetical protein
MCRCPAHKDRSPSLHISERDGRVLVKCFGGCPQSNVIDALRNRGLWPESNLTPAQKHDFTRQRRRDETDIGRARLFADAAAILAEQVLEEMEASDSERVGFTRLVASLRTDTGMLQEFRAWRSAHPKLARALVAAGCHHRERLETLLSNYLDVTLEVQSAA